MFYSWVYAKKCSFIEILTLNDRGIGHPPFFHLLQKLIQSALPVESYLLLYVINFIIGCLFILLFISILNQYKQNIFFITTLVLSAGILDTFIFARMWALVMLLGLALYHTGERYLESGHKKYKIQLLIIFIVGIFTDYNFILLLPYTVIILLKNSSKKQIILHTSFILLLILLVLSYLYTGYLNGYTYSGYLFFDNIIELSFLYLQYVVNFNYIELIALFILIIAVFLLYEYKDKKFTPVHYTFLYLITTSVLFFMIQLDWIRIRWLVLFIPIVIYIVYKKFKLFDINRIWNDPDLRVVAAILLGSMILLSVSPVFWADLVAPRFIAIFFPMIIILLYKNLSGTFLNLFAVIFLFSGINYMASARVSDNFPAGIVDYTEPIVYDAPRAYATQYLKNRKDNDIPMILHMEWFKKSCRVCSMGTSDIDFQSMDSFRFIGWEESFPDSVLAMGFKIVSKKDFGLTPVDRWQLNNLTPIIRKYFFLYEVKKMKENEP